MSDTLPNLTDEQIAELITGSVRVDGTLPYPIFVAVSRAEVLTSIEVITLRRKSLTRELEVLLTLRDDSQDIWYGQLHSPGAMLRINDSQKYFGSSNIFEGAFNRIEEEIGASFTNAPQFVKMDMREGLRGEQLYFLYTAQIDDTKPHNGEFYPVNHLPENTIDFHVDMIMKAAKFFEEHVVGSDIEIKNLQG